MGGRPNRCREQTGRLQLDVDEVALKMLFGDQFGLVCATQESLIGTFGPTSIQRSYDTHTHTHPNPTLITPDANTPHIHLRKKIHLEHNAQNHYGNHISHHLIEFGEFTAHYSCKADFTPNPFGSV